MNYFIIIIVAVVFLGLGFSLGYGKGAEGIDEMEHAIEAQEAANEFLSDTADLLSTENLQSSQTMEYISLLEDVENRDLKAIEAHLLDSVGRSFLLSQEAIELEMATDNDIEIVKRINELSKRSVLFKKVINHE